MITLKKRELLEKYITKTVTVESISRMLDLSRATIYTELKRGLPAGETDIKMYSASLAQQRVEEEAIRKLRGEW